jgi:hypothetical protein
MIKVQIFIKKNTLVITGTVTSANSSPFTTLTDSSATYTTNQYKGHYVKITKGTGLGSVAWIVSNTTTVLTLQTGIQVESGSGYNIYRADYQKLDLFKSEKISVTSQIANANDIGKVFTDYSQSFTIPASVRNNEILSHWYESSVDDGFDHRVRYSGYVEINSQRFKDGNFQLEKASKKNGFIETYTLTFYGNLTQLKDILQDDKLASLNFTTYNHTWDYNNVITRIESATTTGDIKYPLIASKRKFYYKDVTHLSEDITTEAGAINWNELFPAIKVSNIFLQIKAKYGIEFTGSFLLEDQFKFLYLYLKNSEQLNFYSEPQQVRFTQIVGSPTSFPELNLTTDILTINLITAGLYRNYIATVKIIPQSGYTTIPYMVKVYKNNTLYKTYTDLINVRSVSVDTFNTVDYLGTIQNYYFEVSSTATFIYTATTELQRQLNGGTYISAQANSNINYTISANIQIGNYMPDIKIADFFTGIVKAFNLMIIPLGNNIYDLSHLETYYNAGKITDITKYVYANEMEIEKPKLFKSINFQYEKSVNVLNTFFKGLYGTEYGDLIYNPISSNESATYDIKLPFENVLFERTPNTIFESTWLVDKDLKPYTPKPMLIYCNGINSSALTGTNRIIIKTPAVAPNDYYEIGFYNRFSNEYDSIPTDTLHSGLMTMNFGNEQSPWYNVLAPKGLYFRQYKNYIDNLYNIKTRIVKVKALLPPSLLTSNVLKGVKKSGIALNDRLIIRNKRYIINSFTTDLTSGEANLELITDYRGVNAANSVGYRYATYTNLQVERVNINLDTIIYLNDYDSFGIKGAENYLVYTIASDLKADYVLNFDIPYNGSGLDRDDRIGIEYFIAGVSQVTEYIYITQLAV